MSLYNTLFGVNPAAETLLNILLLHASDVPRFRDCFLRGNAIVIYTRTGGANRVAYEDQVAKLRAMPGFLTEHDDSFDSTFACFAYAIPPQYAKLCEVLRMRGAGRDPAVEWPRLLGKLKDPAMKDDPEVVAVIERMRPTMEKIAEAFKGNGSPNRVIEI
jgi:hypothetical protein